MAVNDHGRSLTRVSIAAKLIKFGAFLSINIFTAKNVLEAVAQKPQEGEV